MDSRIAIVGMACRYADADTPAQLWENVLAQRRAFRRIPTVRLDLADYQSDNTDAVDLTYVREAAVLTDYEFDRERFRISGRTFRSTDMTHWLALEVASDALADAGFSDGDGLPRDTTSVILGNTLTGEFSRSSLMRLRWPYVRRTVEAGLEQEGWSPQERQRFLSRLEASYKQPFPEPTEDTLAGGLANTIAGRICNYFDLKGGGYTVDGACASSLLAVTTTCRDLLVGDVDVAIAGGVDLSLDPFELVGFARTGALTPDQMYVFDEKSRGFLPGEGCGMIVLMRYTDAIAQNRRIYAVVRGWGISSDGHGGITRPETEGQQLALQRAYKRAGFGIETVQYFEAHGTGTAVGDATELTTITRLLEEAGNLAGPATVGSIKALIGHTKAAAGTAALIKTAMALHHRVLPPTAGCETPHEVLRNTSALQALPYPQVWERDAPLRAGVSAMGFGGINSHVVLEAVSDYQRLTLTHREQMLASSVQDAELFLFDADSPEALEEILRQTHSRVRECSHAELGDFAAWLSRRLSFGPVRAAVIAATPSEAEERLQRLLALVQQGTARHHDTDRGIFLSTQTSDVRRIGYLFTGQGASIKRESGLLGRRFQTVQQLYHQYPLPAGEDVSRTNILQPGVVRDSLVGLHLLGQLGIHATAALGHSLGELTALHWGGAYDAATLFRLASRRGHIMASLTPDNSGMASLFTDETTAQTLVEPGGAVIAGINSPDQTVVSGTTQQLERVIQRASRRGIQSMRLPVSHAFHSPLVEPAAHAFADELRGCRFEPLRANIYSTVTGQLLERDADLATLLHEQIMKPVQFVPALRQLAEQVDLLIEVGPGRILAGLASRTLANQHPIIALDLDGTSANGLLKAAGCAFALGVPVRHERLFDDRYTRAFDPDRTPGYLVNPCELAPDIGDRLPNPDTAAPRIEVLTPDLEDDTISEDESAVTIVQKLVAKAAELPIDAIKPDSRMLSDLHLNSLRVSQIVIETARILQIAPPISPTQYANASVEEIAEALIQIEAHSETAHPAASTVSGIENWVRCFTVQTVEHPLEEAPPAQGRGQWQILGDPEDVFVQQLRAQFDAPGHGMVVCLPERAGEEHIEFVLDAMQSALRAPGKEPFCFGIVERSGDSFGAMGRTFHLEAQNVKTCVIRLPDAPVEQQIQWTTYELLNAADYTEVNYTEDGRRRVPVLEPIDIPVNDNPIALSADDVLLVTGGGKGITAECALAIARKTGVRLALVGRSRESAPELAENLARMRQHGVDFIYVAADLSKRDNVERAVSQVQEELGPITAVLHGAARNIPTSLLNLNAATFEKTLAPKVAAARYLMEAIPLDQLRFFITFSSIIGRVGLPGEADYALANDWLTALTEQVQLQNPDCECLALEWSVWAGTGMGERLGTLEQLQREGISPISPDHGVDVLLRLLANSVQAVAVVISGRFAQTPTLKQREVRLPLWRFLERPLFHYPGVELIVESQISVDTDPYLLDHVMDGIPLFPAVMGLEAMTQTAMALAETTQVPALTDVAFKRPVSVSPDEPLVLRLAALRHETGAIDVALRASQTNFQVDHFTARALFNTDDEEFNHTALEMPQSATNVPADDLYERFFFQSGRFQRIRHYETLSATRVEASLQHGSARWFSMYLPQEMLLGDAGLRDASLHMIQVCVPHRTLLPVGVDRVDISGKLAESQHYSARAIECDYHDGIYTYDLQILDEAGQICEFWHGARFRTVEGTGFNGDWHPALLSALIERQIRVVSLNTPLSVYIGFDITTAQLLQDNFPAGAELQHRPDGKPELLNVLAAAPEISISHADGMTMCVNSPHKVACDLVEVSSLGHWETLFSTEQETLVQTIIENSKLAPQQAAACVWTISECLTKAGFVSSQLPVLDKVFDENWLLFDAPSFSITTSLFSVEGRNQQYAAGILVEK